MHAASAVVAQGVKIIPESARLRGTLRKRRREMGIELMSALRLTRQTRVLREKSPNSTVLRRSMVPGEEQVERK